MSNVTNEPATRKPKFLYFDLGNVLLNFSHRRAAEQMAAVCDTTAERMWATVFDGGMNHRLDAGTLTTQDFYTALCDGFACRPDFEALCLAGSDIFEVNYSMQAVVAALSLAGYRLGLLSNTSDLHWRFITAGRYALVPGMFERTILSFEHRAMKPEPEIFRIAAAEAGVEPHEVFYVDDLPANVAGARAAGFDAVQYTDTASYVDELRRRGVCINY
ncbi:MAG TPA: HAD family phosphatase [Pirellulales bacterium]|nr:HAD family phosphatase [Pirellulales bacterium]